MLEVMPHICWSKMDESTIVIRLDNARADVEYRVALDGYAWTGPSEDGLYRFSGAEAGKRYVISCERREGTSWAEACPPVTLNFVPLVSRAGVRLFSLERPKGGGEAGTVWGADRGPVKVVSEAW